jgi:hypothetical protein
VDIEQETDAMRQAAEEEKTNAEAAERVRDIRTTAKYLWAAKVGCGVTGYWPRVWRKLAPVVLAIALGYRPGLAGECANGQCEMPAGESRSAGGQPAGLHRGIIHANISTRVERRQARRLARRAHLVHRWTRA